LRTLLRPGTVALRWVPWAAAVAGIVVLAAIPHLFKPPAPGPPRNATFAQGGLNHEGRVDILDAFALARQLKQSGTTSLKWDVNGDGVVDERDVTALAARAVRLVEGGGS
jgi:hypothetical protein